MIEQAHVKATIMLERLRRLSTGAIWELVRFHTQKDITINTIPFDDIRKLEGTNAEMAPRVAKFVKKLIKGQGMGKEGRSFGPEVEGQTHQVLYEKAFERELSTRVLHVYLNVVII